MQGYRAPASGLYDGDGYYGAVKDVGGRDGRRGLVRGDTEGLEVVGFEPEWLEGVREQSQKEAVRGGEQVEKEVVDVMRLHNSQDEVARQGLLPEMQALYDVDTVKEAVMCFDIGSDLPANGAGSRAGSPAPGGPAQQGEDEKKKQRRICGVPSTWLLALFISTILIIGIIIGVALGLTRHTRRRPVSEATPTAIRGNSSLAAVAFEDANNIMQHRLYYQTEDSVISESAWNATTGIWYISNSNIVTGKPGTPIAAAKSVGPNAEPVSLSCPADDMHKDQALNLCFSK